MFKNPDSQRHAIQKAFDDALGIQAGTKFDLRSSFLSASIPAGQTDDQDDDGDEQDGDDDDSDDEDSDEDDNDGDDDGASGSGKKKEDVNDPEKQRLSNEAAKWRKKFRAEQKARREEAAARKDDKGDDKGDPEVAKALRAERAGRKIDRAVFTSGIIPEEAEFLEMYLERRIEEFTDEDGGVDDDELTSVIEEFFDKHPAKKASAKKDTKKEDDEEDESKRQPSGRQTNGKKKSSTEASREALAKKFPALARR